MEVPAPVREVEPLVTHVRAAGGLVRVHVWPALDLDVDDEPRGRPRARRRRSEAGRPVLLAFHGALDSGAVFGPLAAALGRRWTVVAPDAPGHGGTPWVAADVFRLVDLAGAGLAVLDALPSIGGRRAPVVVLGHSVGALTATDVAASRPRVVRHVVLEEPAGVRLRPARSQARFRRELEALQAMPDADRLGLARAEHPDWPADELQPWSRARKEADVAHLRVPVDRGEPLAARLADVRCPVTIVRGLPARGALVSSAAARRLAGVCRAGCEVVALDAGHSPRREARTPFVATLAATLGRYEP